MLEERSLFNEGFYLESNLDVAEAKAKGVVNSGFDHFEKFGKFEGRNPSALFDQSFYLNKYSDVAQAVGKGNFGSAFDHFMLFGQKELRDPSVVFQANYYLSKNPDVDRAVKKDELTGIEHFVKYGIDEGRASAKTFDVSYYLKYNSDLKAAGFDYRQALKHFVTYELKEKRDAYPVDIITGNPGVTPIADFNLAPIPNTNDITKQPQTQPVTTLPVTGNSNDQTQPVTTLPVTGNSNDQTQPVTTLPVTGNSNDQTQPVTTLPVTGNSNDQTQPVTTLPVTENSNDQTQPVTTPSDTSDDLNDEIQPTTTAKNDNQLNTLPTLAQTLSGVEKEPTPPRDMAPDAGGKDPNKNSAPKHLEFSIAKKEYKKGEIIRLQNGWVFDGNGTADLDRVEFWMDGKPDKEKGEYIQNATNFIGYSQDDRWGRFNYSLNGLAPGQYKLKGIAYDKEGRKSNAVTVHFNVSNEELPMPLIGVIDTGFSANNPDIDYSRITLGKDLVDGDNNPLLQAGEGNEHGTHILGIIAATQNNGVGISGMNDQAPLWLGRAIGSGKWAESLIEFVDAAKASGQPKALVNLSLDMTQVNPDGSVTTRYEFTPKEREALEYARQNGVLIVAAAGNDGDVMSVLGQASQEFDNIITVGAANGNQRADYSSFGYGLDIVTEGGTIANPIVSTVGDDVGTMAGTSVAAAQVTGAASLVWEANPGLNYRQVIEVLKSNATDLNTVGWDKETGAGFLNVDKAVEAAKGIAPVAYAPDAFLTPTTWGLDGQVIPEERAINLSGVTDSSKIAVQINGGVNIRPSADTSSAALGKLSPGAQVEFDYQTQGELIIDPNNEGSSDVWYHLADGSGFVSGLYITNVQEIPSEPQQPSDPGSGITDPGSGITDPGSGITDPGSGITDPGSGITNPTNSINLNGYTIGGNFYSVFQNYQGTLGNPISDAIQYSGDVSYQLFENGSIVTSQYGTFPLYGGIRQTYLNNGGLNGWLGEPKSAEIDRGNGNVIQYFESGYIYWNGSRATAYRYATTPPQTSPNIGSQLGVTMPDFNQPAYRENNIFWQSGYAPASTHPAYTNLGSALGNCTWYVNGRLQQLGYNTTTLIKLNGNASEWDNLAANAGISMSSTPQVGDIAQWESGHVAVVEKVNPDGTILISESSYPISAGVADYLYKTETISASSPSRFIRLPYSGSSSVDTLIRTGVAGGGNPIDGNPTSTPILPYTRTIEMQTIFGKQTDNIGLWFADGSSKAIDPSKNTWLVIHGLTLNTAPPDKNVLQELDDNTHLANAVDGYSPDDQVLVLDWRNEAYSYSPIPDPHIGARWIDSVASWTADQLMNKFNIANSNINLIGHSLGAYVAAEIAAKIPGGVNKIIALDPATEVGRPYNFGGGHNSSQVNFSNNSSWSWGFYGSLLGSPDRARTADESFNIDFGLLSIEMDTAHGAVRKLFKDMLEEANDKTVSSNGDIFGLDRMNSSGKPWVIDYGSKWEAKIEAKQENGRWIPIKIIPETPIAIESGSSHGANGI